MRSPGSTLASWSCSTPGPNATGEVSSKFLYALAGQADREGPVNHDVFLAFNRVVSSGRFGTGVSRITLRVREAK